MADEPIPTPMDALQAGIDRGGAPDAEDAKAKAREEADVKAWADRIKRARKYDEPARVQYAKDRRYARGDSGSEVAANIVGTNIDILESFLYARDPDVDVRPSPSAEPPSMDALRDAAEESVKGHPDVQAVHDETFQGVMQDSGGDQATAKKAAQQAADAFTAKRVKDQFEQLRKRYQSRQRDNKAFAETLEIIISRLWKDARLKTRGTRWTRSSLTIGVGVLKASWQERTAPSPETVQAINDLQPNMARATALRAEIADDPGDSDAKIAELQRQMTALQSQAERVIARGFVVDVVQGEDFQVAPGYAIADHLDAPWNAHRIAMRHEDAKAEFKLTNEQCKQATRFAAKKPVMARNESAMLVDDLRASEADAYTSGASGDGYGDDTGGQTDGEFVMLWEIWDRDSNSVLTMIEGIRGWVKPAWNPTATTRFYPFFLVCTSEVDGQRHPQSLPSRSAKLVDEYQRIGSAEAEHRRRVIPKTGFNAGLMSPEDAAKLSRATIQEMVPIKPTQPNTPIGNILQQITYAQIDQNLYDRSRINNELERIWGIQEALSGSINTSKTATEAQIQQSGFNARTGGRRDALEAALNDLAQYTAEVAHANISAEDAQAMAGPDAMWPAYQGPNDLNSLVVVDIRAGSSGKPDTTAERQAWANQLPLLQNGIVQIGQLRKADPLDVADALETLLQITAERSGDRIDIGSLVPQAGNGDDGSAAPSAEPAPPPLPIQQSALMGPQTVALTTVLDQVRQSILSPESATAVIQAAFPSIPPPLVQQMVGGVAVTPGLGELGGMPGVPAPTATAAQVPHGQPTVDELPPELQHVVAALTQQHPAQPPQSSIPTQPQQNI